MQVTVLIVDGITTNRVALKVKLSAAWYDVFTAGSGAEALRAVSSNKPSLIIIADDLPDMSAESLCGALSGAQGSGEQVPVIALSARGEDRLALLRAGAQEVLHCPVNDRLLVARVRSLLRAHAAETEWQLRDGTCRALGFAEPHTCFDHIAPVLMMAEPGALPPLLMGALAATPGLKITCASVEHVMQNSEPRCDANVMLLPLSPHMPEPGLELLSDLRAQPDMRHKALLVLVPPGRQDLAVQALDLGADDVAITPDVASENVPADRSDLAAELALRITRLNRRHQIGQTLRRNVRQGAEAALRDPLTGLFNRRYALPHLERIAEQCHQQARPYSVMVADLDHFKRVNDTHGHAVGDQVLAECARRMQQNMRSVDLLARIGGEEFLVVLPGADQNAARRAALRVCQQISQSPVSVPGVQEPLRVTVSIGLAVSHVQADLFDDPGAGLKMTPKQMLKRADQALYSAKQRGRNQFMLERSAA